MPANQKIKKDRPVQPASTRWTVPITQETTQMTHQRITETATVDPVDAATASEVASPAINRALIGIAEGDLAAVLAALEAGPGGDCRSCTHPDAGQVEHDYVDGGWWHDVTVGDIPVVANDMTDDEARNVPLHVAIMRHLNSPAGVVLSPKGWGEGAEFDLAGVREAIRVLSMAERLLAIEVDGGAR